MRFPLCWHLKKDSRAIKKITIGYRFLILKFDDMLDQLSGAVTFSKIDLRGSYHHIRMHLCDKWKKTFKTRDDHSSFNKKSMDRTMFLRRSTTMLMWLTYQVG